MSRHSFPRIAPSDLRDHADEARVTRIWERIEHDLPGQESAGSPIRRWGLAYVAAAAVVAAFGGGVLVGHLAWNRRFPDAVPAHPIIEHASVDVLASGTDRRTFQLNGGVRLTLSPATTVEVERTSADLLTLKLVQGEAVIDTAGSARKALAIVAGEARLDTQTGGALSVRRNTEDLDVAVTDGTVRVTSPAGSQQLGRGDRVEAVPLHTPVYNAVAPVTAPRVAVRSPRRPRDAHPVVAKPSTVPEWLVRYDSNDYEGAFALLKERDINATIDSARSAKELSAIAVVSAMRDRSAEIRANERLVTGFPRDQRASLAAGRLSTLYQGLGQLDRARFYRGQVELLARNATDGSDSLVCNLIDRETDKTKAAILAKEYLDKYPDGECHEKFVRMLQGEGIVPAPELDPVFPPPRL